MSGVNTWLLLDGGIGRVLGGRAGFESASAGIGARRDHRQESGINGRTGYSGQAVHVEDGARVRRMGDKIGKGRRATRRAVGGDGGTPCPDTTRSGKAAGGGRCV